MIFSNITITDPPQPLPIPIKSDRDKEGLFSGSEVLLRNPTNRCFASHLQAPETEQSASSVSGKSPLERGGSLFAGWQMARRGVFITTIILFGLFFELSFAQQYNAIPLPPFKGGLNEPIFESSNIDSTQRLEQFLKIAAEN